MSEEPVAYLNTYSDGSTTFTRANIFSLSKPLYTKEQLQPKVKMTQEEFDEFKRLKALTTSLFTAINLITKTDNYKRLKISSGIANGFNDIEWQNNFSYVYINFTYANPEETIEIVTNKKWFVRSKRENPDAKGWYDWLIYHDNEYETPEYYDYNSIPYRAMKFDTKKKQKNG